MHGCVNTVERDVGGTYVGRSGCMHTSRCKAGAKVTSASSLGGLSPVGG
jgi:hypothetical protein